MILVSIYCCYCCCSWIILVEVLQVSPQIPCNRCRNSGRRAPFWRWNKNAPAVGRRLGDDFFMKTWENISIHQFWIVFSVFLILLLSLSPPHADRLPTSQPKRTAHGNHGIYGNWRWWRHGNRLLWGVRPATAVLSCTGQSGGPCAEVGTCWNHLEVSIYG